MEIQLFIITGHIYYISEVNSTNPSPDNELYLSGFFLCLSEFCLYLQNCSALLKMAEEKTTIANDVTEVSHIQLCPFCLCDEQSSLITCEFVYEMCS